MSAVSDTPTVSTAVPGISVDVSVAVTVTAPAATPVARPLAETVAVAVLDEDQVTRSVRFCVLRLEIEAGRCELLGTADADDAHRWRHRDGHQHSG